MRAWSFVLVVACIGVALGCAESTEEQLSAEEYVDRYARSVCERSVRCPGWSDSTCHPASSPGAAVDSLLHFDPSNARRCLEWLEATDCRTWTADAFEACSRAFHGTREAGEPCTFSDQCAWELRCAPESIFGPIDATCAGVCTARLAEGESCSDDLVRSCERGLQCLRTADDFEQTCRRLPSAGERCARSGICDFGLVCDRVEDVCFPWEERDGRPCDPTAPNACTLGFVCSAAGRCEPEPLPAGPGEPCGSATCVSGFACVDGLCLAHGLPGERCDALRPCYQGECVEGTCQLLPAGARCESRDDCDDGWCRGEDRTCVPLTPLGGSCTETSECGGYPNACVSGTCVSLASCEG